MSTAPYSALLLSLTLALGGCQGSQKDAPAPAEPQPPSAPGKSPEATAPPKGEAPAPTIKDTMAFDAKITYLQSLTPTSGEEAINLLDGDPGTVFKAGVKDGVDEGILLRFEGSTALRAVEISPCPKKKVAPEFDLYVNGAIATGMVDQEEDGRRVARLAATGGSLEARSLFLQFLEEEVCVGELRLIGDGGNPIAVAPPRGAKGKVTTSSTLSPEDAYHPAFLFDQRTDFGWVEGAKSTGPGERISIEFEAPQDISALEVWNGYQRSADHFKKNARAKNVRIEADGKPALMITLRDKQGPQTIQLESPIKAKKLELIIDSAYGGSRYEDMVISELRFHDAKGPFTLLSDDRANRAALMKASVNDTVLETFANKRHTAVCEEGALYEGVSRQSVKFRTNHTFVLYSSLEDGDGGNSRREVTDGAWVVAAADVNSATLKLYGRSHRTSESFIPYGNSETKNSTKIAGGDLKVTSVKSLGEAGLQGVLLRWQKAGLPEHVYRCETLDGFEKDALKAYTTLVARDAYIVEGKALTQILWEPAKG